MTEQEKSGLPGYHNTSESVHKMTVTGGQDIEAAKATPADTEQFRWLDFVMSVTSYVCTKCYLINTAICSNSTQSSGHQQPASSEEFVTGLGPISQTDLSQFLGLILK